MLRIIIDYGEEVEEGSGDDDDDEEMENPTNALKCKELAEMISLTSWCSYPALKLYTQKWRHKRVDVDLSQSGSASGDGSAKPRSRKTTLQDVMRMLHIIRSPDAHYLLQRWAGTGGIPRSEQPSENRVPLNPFHSSGEGGFVSEFNNIELVHDIVEIPPKYQSEFREFFDFPADDVGFNPIAKPCEQINGTQLYALFRNLKEKYATAYKNWSASGQNSPDTFADFCSGSLQILAFFIAFEGEQTSTLWTSLLHSAVPTAAVKKRVKMNAKQQRDDEKRRRAMANSGSRELRAMNERQEMQSSAIMEAAKAETAKMDAQRVRLVRTHFHTPPPLNPHELFFRAPIMQKSSHIFLFYSNTIPH